jgi:hypothetical protein
MSNAADKRSPLEALQRLPHFSRSPTVVLCPHQLLMLGYKTITQYC